MGMEPITRRLHLDRMEIFLVLGIMFLVSSLMFTLGVMVGMGVPAPRSSFSAASSTEHSTVVSHNDEAPSKNHDHSEDRAPASTADHASLKKLPGAELKKAFRDSKQKALVEMTLRDTPDTQPKSIVDAQAHFEASGDSNRSPASVDEKKKDVKKGAPVKVANSVAVKSLFERRPGSKDRFSPIPGQFTVQVGSYSTADESDAKVFELRKAGFNDAYVQSVKTKKGDVWYRVGVGSFTKSPWAKKIGERVVRRQLSSDFFVRQVE